jgi:uncharacterized protein with ParB-like and HNH nuclease domain
MSNESTDVIKPVAVFELLNRNYFIRSYQRGYRWAEQQVTALLNDIENFEQKDGSWYCLQPVLPTLNLPV